jgi:ankyrin repeat protein
MQESGHLNTPIMLACEKLQKNVIERLLLAGANCNL